MLEEFGIPDSSSEGIRRIADSETRYAKDLKANVQQALKNKELSPKESAFIGLSVSVNDQSNIGIEVFTALSKKHGATNNEIAEVYSCTSLLAMNNVFYKFRHMVDKEFYSKSLAGIKMSVVGKPVLGKEFFELLSLVVSTLNGCEQCVKSHENSVLKHDCSEVRVYEAVKSASILRGLIVLL
jgi:lipoyl-dependent peroxiredoxin subunit D